MLSRFINAACTGITSERKMTARSKAESITTIPMNSGSLLARTPEKSIDPAVNPPTSGRAGRCFWNGGSTWSRSRWTRSVVACAWGAEAG